MDTNSLLLIKEIIKHDTYELRSLVGSDVRIIVDIGANTGIFSLYARILFPYARIIALEPASLNFLELKKLGESLSIETHKLALGDGSSIQLDCEEGAQAKIIGTGNIPTIRLENIPLKFNFDPHENIIWKIDCEGGEKFICNNMRAEQVLKQSLQWGLEIHFDQTKWNNHNYTIWNKWLDSMHNDKCFYVKRRLIEKHGLGTVVCRNYILRVLKDIVD